MQVVFFGSPSFALPSLESLRDAGHTLALVVSQPGKPVGRKGELMDPPVAARAKSLGIQVFQPPTLKDDAALARLSAAGADVFVVVAYGKILAQRVLDIPRLGCVNVHGSLLPRWRGASPVQAAILAGDAVTGISIMKLDAGMDTGPVYTMRETRIGEEESAEVLGARLATIGAQALIETLYFLEGESDDADAPAPRGAAGAEEPAPHAPSKKIFNPPLTQNSLLSKSCPKITREDARADWTRPAIELSRRSRAFTPWPGLFTIRGNTRVKLSGLSLEEESGQVRVRAEGSPPGTVLEAGPRVVVACGEGAVSIGTLQVEGRRALPAAEFVRGERVLSGERWG
ncbi:MAG: methionyl-tRNA formyltransferase [Acidobacteriota bacterium]